MNPLFISGRDEANTSSPFSGRPILRETLTGFEWKRFVTSWRFACYRNTSTRNTTVDIKSLFVEKIRIILLYILYGSKANIWRVKMPNKYYRFITLHVSRPYTLPQGRSKPENTCLFDITVYDIYAFYNCECISFAFNICHRRSIVSVSFPTLLCNHAHIRNVKIITIEF